MGFMKKLLVVLLSLTCIVACAFGITACNPSDTGNTGNTGNTGDVGNNGENTGNNGENTGNTGDGEGEKPGDNTFADGWTFDGDYHWHAATDGSDLVDGKGLHDWTVDNSKSTAATCSSAGSTVYKCSVCGAEKTETAPQLSHKWSGEKTVEATCTTAGYVYKVCENAGCTATTRISEIKAVGHQPDGEATCTNGVTCTVCDKLIQPAKGHNYEVTSETPATCTEDGHAHYECADCGDGYDITTQTATGHLIVWSDKKQYKGTQDACYVVLGECAVCEKKFESENAVSNHIFKSSISRAATCTEYGEKTYTCECGYSYTENYSDSAAHDWGAPVTNGNIATYTCGHNHAHIKSAVIYSETSADVAVSDLTKAGSVNLGGTSIALDDDVKKTIIGSETVKLSADTLSADELPDSLGDNTEYIGGSTVYNLTLNVGGNNVSDLGGKVTVTVPYTLEEGEDPDNIVIWYINGTQLDEIEGGKYSNGYVIFETTHFSYYSVTRMTPAQRCAKYGHSWQTVKEEPTCLLAGYTMQLCTRCGKHEKKDIPATGHDWIVETTPATCTANGLSKYECKTCHVKYEVVLLSTGHNWIASELTEATCEHSGHAKYTCGGCNETYEVTTAQTAHTFKSTIIKATCTEAGYTHNECIVCGFAKDTDHVEALGHTPATRTVAPTCTVGGFTLTYCAVCGEEIKKDNLKDATGHKTVNGVCTVCGEGCDHSYKAGKPVAATCTEEGYTVYTCSKCGNSYKGNIVAALGHDFGIDECSRCDAVNPAAADYYLNLINTSLAGTVTIKVKDLSFDLYEEATILTGGETTTEIKKYVTIEQLDVVELAISLSENGALLASGKGKVSVAVTDDDVFTVNCIVAVKDDKAYLIMDSDSEEFVMGSMAVDVDYLLKSMFNNEEFTYAKFKEYLLWFNSDVQTAVNKVITENSETVVKVLKTALNYIFTREDKTDGYSYTLNFDKVAELNEAFSNATVEKLVNGVLGSGMYEALPDTAEALLKLTPETAIAVLTELGFNKSQICLAVDTFVYLFKGEVISSEEILDEMLKGEFGDMTVAEFIAQIYSDKTDKEITAEEINGFVKEQLPELLAQYKDSTVYDIIAEASGVPVEQLSAMIDEVLKTYLPVAQQGAQLGFTTDKAGNVTSAKIVADIANMPVGGYDTNDFHFEESGDTVICVYHGTPVATYADGVYTDMDGNEYTDVKDLFAALNIDYSIYQMFVSLSGSAEFAFGGDVKIDESIISSVVGKQPVFEKNAEIEAYSYKNYEYDRDYPSFFTREVGSEMRIYTDANGKIIKIVETTEERHRSINYVRGQYIYCYEDFRSRVYEYDLTSGAMTSVVKDYCKNTDLYSMQCPQKGAENHSESQLIVVKDTGFIISDVITYKYSNDYNSPHGYVSFCYNYKDKTFKNDDPHNPENLVLNEAKSDITCGGYYYYECEDCGYSRKQHIYHLGKHNNVVYELIKGEGSSCTDGYIEKHVCSECNQIINSYRHYSHDTHAFDIDLTQYGSICEHTLRVYGCVCGQKMYTEMRHGWYDDLGEKWDSIVRNGNVSYVYNGEQYRAILFTCAVTDCNFSFAYFETYDKDEHCALIRTEHWMFGVTFDNKTGIVSGGEELALSSQNGYSHNNTVVSVEIPNGVRETYKCNDCGLITRVEEHTSVKDSNGREISRTDITWTYKDDVNDNTVREVEKYEYTYEYDAVGNRIRETEERTYYYGEMSEDNLGECRKIERIYTYNEDGEKASYKLIETYYNFGLTVSSRNTQEYIYVLGYPFQTLRLEENYNYDGETDWHKYEYFYRDGKYCSPTVIESTNYSVGEEREGEVNHRTSGEFITYPTCTQCGTRNCIFCGEAVQSESPRGHHYDDGVCIYCGLENANCIDGKVTFEDLSYTSDTEYVIGYYNPETDYYSFNISLVYTAENGDEEYLVLYGLQYSEIKNYEYYGSGKVSFSIADIQRLAEENNIEEYMIRVTFSPEGYDSELDYSITIDAHSWVQGTAVVLYESETEIDVYYCPECKLIKGYGYFNCYRANYDEENEMYVYQGNCLDTHGNYVKLALIAQTSLNGIQIDKIDY